MSKSAPAARAVPSPLVDGPVVKVVHVPQVQVGEKTIEIPQLQTIAKIVDIPEIQTKQFFMSLLMRSCVVINLRRYAT